MSTTQQSTQCLSGISADDPYYLIVRCLDLSVDGQLPSLAHLSGGCRLDQTTYRFPYGVICRLAGRQQRGERFTIDSDGGVESNTPFDITTVTHKAPHTSCLCPCGMPLTGRIDQKYCSPRCRQQASRSNPERIAQNGGSRSVTGMIHSHHPPVTPYNGK